MLATARTFSLLGVEAIRVDAEVDIHRGLPSFSLVGLPDTAVRESRERVRAAIVNSGFEFPQQRITVNLAPADLRKAGPGFDLAIAAAVLAASAQVKPEALDKWSLAGELALDGGVRAVQGALAMAERASADGLAGIAVPAANALEAALIDGLVVAPIRSLADLDRLLRDGELPEPEATPPAAQPRLLPDLADLRGQPSLRRALEVAAAGAHSLLITGPPGAGKSLAARRLPSILPEPCSAEAIEITRIAGAAGNGHRGHGLAPRPFRSPHHSISPAGLVGGGNPPRPGEITLAHGGVLFLDEVPEFSRASLEALRQPLEDGSVTITRARHSITFPTAFQLVAAANPCPCGHGEDSEACDCSPVQLKAYANRISGALSDRLDLIIAVAQPPAEALAGDPGVSSATVRTEVAEARARAGRRLGPGRANASMSGDEARTHAKLTTAAADHLSKAHARYGLSGRGWDRVLKVARTCADLAAAERVDVAHVGEALTGRTRSR